MESKTLRSKTIDHLGLVSGMFDELGLVEKIDSFVPQDVEFRELSIGTICKALVLNGLGFTERTLYMVSNFFSDKPVETLLGAGVMAEHLNDSVLGRALDDIYSFGTTRLYQCLVPSICKTLGLESSRFAHMDSTDFHLDGRYNSETDTIPDSTIHLTKGYSRDHRPDLNQVVLNLIVENQAGIPLHMEALSGNSSDKIVFRETIKEHIAQLQNVAQFEYLVMDSAGYTSETISEYSDNIKWISRVPESIKTCAEAVLSLQELVPLDDKYSYKALESNYSGIPQRWLLVWSEEAWDRETKTLDRNWQKKGEIELRHWSSLQKEEFSCSTDAEKAMAAFQKKCKYLTFNEIKIVEIPKYIKKGRPPKNRPPDRHVFKITSYPCSDIGIHEEKKQGKGRFIIATNELDKEKLSDKELLAAYKGQSKVEKGFRFLKDPQFVARNFFVKKPERLEALVFIMTLCLTVYSALEYKIRTNLKELDKSIPNQLRKPTNKPTARWVFQLFRGIHFLYGLNTEKPVCLNFNDIHQVIIEVLGQNYKKYYLRI